MEAIERVLDAGNSSRPPVIHIGYLAGARDRPGGADLVAHPRDAALCRDGLCTQGHAQAACAMLEPVAGRLSGMMLRPSPVAGLRPQASSARSWPVRRPQATQQASAPPRSAPAAGPGWLTYCNKHEAVGAGQVGNAPLAEIAARIHVVPDMGDMRAGLQAPSRVDGGAPFGRRGRY